LFIILHCSYSLLMTHVAQSQLFEGDPDELTFTLDVTSIQEKKYYAAGQYVAWSLLHGGPGFSALAPELYWMMVGKKVDLTNCTKHICNEEVKQTIEKVKISLFYLHCNLVLLVWKHALRFTFNAFLVDNSIKIVYAFSIRLLNFYC